MNKILLFFAFLIGCSSANSQSCDLCGNWSFDRFDYAGYITTDFIKVSFNSIIIFLYIG